MPIYVPGKVVLAQTYVGTDDPDAAVYVAAVEAADGQILETATRVAIHSFVKGCKADGIWPAIKASCILAGARTLAGALVPLAGTAPTNFNFVSGDYNRKTGLMGNGSTKYIRPNRNNNVDPQNSKHISVFASTLADEVAYILDGGETASGRSQLVGLPTRKIDFAVNSNTRTTGSNLNVSGFIGASRTNSSQQILRVNGSEEIATVASTFPVTANMRIFSGVNGSSYSNSRLAFYSIGEALDLALLDARVTALINAFAAAIP
jgi:hypothetical protein